MSTYRISELARRTAVSASTLRFYEQAVRRLEFVGAAKLLGLPLEEIRELLGVWEDGECVHVRAKLRPLVATRIAEAQRRIAELTAFAAHLERVHDELGGAAPSGRCGPGCGCVPAQAVGPVSIELMGPLSDPMLGATR